MTAPLRFLLDQGFPKPPDGLSWDQLDKTVRLEHFAATFPEHAKVSTPDWMLYLLARSHDLHAVVTTDHNQLTQNEEMISLQLTGLGLVTWKGRQEDPLVLYGQLLAYMPKIVAGLRAKPATVVTLPNPMLRPKEHFRSASDHARALKRHDDLSYPERRSQALKTMRRHLSENTDGALLNYLPTN